MPLTDTGIRNVKPKDRPYKLTDGNGLFLYVTSAGARLWRLKYRFAGKERSLSIGPYPAVTIKMARKACEEAKAQLAARIDPSQAKRTAKLEAEATTLHTFDAIAKEYIAKLSRKNRAKRTLAKVEWLLSLAKESIGHRPVRDVSAADVLEALRKVESRGRHETAKRLRSTIGAVFRYAVATARADNDPTFAEGRVDAPGGEVSPCHHGQEGARGPAAGDRRV